MWSLSVTAMVLAVPILLRPLKAIFETRQSTFFQYTTQPSARLTANSYYVDSVWFCNYFWTLHHLPQQTFKGNEPRHHRHRWCWCPASQNFLAAYTPPCRAKRQPMFPDCVGRTCLSRVSLPQPGRTANCAWLCGKALRNLGSTTSHNQSQSTWRFVSFSNSIRNQTVWLFLGPPLNYLLYFVACSCVCCTETLETSQAYRASEFLMIFTGWLVLATWFPGESCIHFAVRHLQLEALEFLVNQPGANKALPLQPCHRTGLSHESCTEVTIYIHILCVHLHWLALIRNDASSVGGFKKLPNWTAEIGCRSLWCAHTTGSTGEWFREKHL